MGTQHEASGEPGQGFSFDQGGAQAAQLSLVGSGETLIQAFADKQGEHRVSQEFQALVIGLAGAAVGERGAQQCRVAETVAETRREIVGPLTPWRHRRW